MKRYAVALLLPLVASGCHEAHTVPTEIEPLGDGPYAVSSTNLEVAAEYADIGDDAMHEILLGQPTASGQLRSLADILKHPESAFIVDVPVPGDKEIYGPARGLILPIVTFLTFPASPRPHSRPYEFPYHDARYGAFEDMLEPGERPRFANPGERYPLIILTHGDLAHGLYEVQRAHRLASHGYVVVVINYGDDRTRQPDQLNFHLGYLRPFLTRAVLDALLASETYGPHIDAENIGIAGHSFGGFTALAIAGASFQGNKASVSDERIKAASIAAPWVGGYDNGDEIYAFGPANADIARVDIPVISFFGTEDEVALATTILPAMKILSGPTYVVELLDQPHIFETGSWEDRDNWELMFFAAYLKHDPKSLERLELGESMKGGNADLQLFDYQILPDEH
jgi:dienelactone hydrolase